MFYLQTPRGVLCFDAVVAAQLLCAHKEPRAQRAVLVCCQPSSKSQLFTNFLCSVFFANLFCFCLPLLTWLFNEFVYLLSSDACARCAALLLHSLSHSATVEPQHNGQPQSRHSHAIRICIQNGHQRAPTNLCTRGKYSYMQHLGRLPNRLRLMSYSCGRQLWHFSRRRCGSSLPQCLLSLLTACCCNTKAITLHAAKSFRCGFVSGAYTLTRTHMQLHLHINMPFLIPKRLACNRKQHLVFVIIIFLHIKTFQLVSASIISEALF